MIKPSIFALIIFGFLVLATSCDRPVCENANPIFDKNPPDSKAYKDELVKQLLKVDKAKLAYWFDNYKDNQNSQFIQANVQGDGLCAKIILTVNESDKGIEELLVNKGGGYSGAELQDLKFEIKQDDVSTEFIFQEVSNIAD